ncbi:MAG: tripartite tricarboxylate transporter substrate-binding protein [bacterium]
MAEAGFKDVVAEGRFGFLAPAGTPREIVQRIHAVLAQAARAADVRERFAKLGFEATSDTPEQFAALLRSDFDRYGRLIRRLGITAQ